MVDTETFEHPSGAQALLFGQSLDQRRSSELSSTPAKATTRAFSGVFIPTSQINKRDYISFPQESIIARVLKEHDDDSDNVQYSVRFEDGHIEELAFDDLLKHTNGQEALNSFQNESEQEEEADSDIINLSESSDNTSEVEILPRRAGRLRGRTVIQNDSGSEDELSMAPARLSSRRATKQTRITRFSTATRSRSTRASTAQTSALASEDPESSDSEDVGRRRSTRVKDTRALRRSSRNVQEDDDDLIHLVDEDDSSDSMMRSDVLPKTRKRGRPAGSKPAKFRKINEGTRQSVRSTRHLESMQDPGLGEQYRSESDGPRAPPKAQGAREAFQPLPSTDPFHLRHCQQCDTCDEWGSAARQLVHCQGCSLSYHKACLGPRGSRDHLVTKIGEGNFVLQCRRCIGYNKEKDHTAPDHAMCQSCREHGHASLPFRKRRTPAQEEKDREANNGEDPIKQVDPSRINNVANVLFRCVGCTRAFHFHHLRSRDDFVTVDDDEDRIAERRYKEHSQDWLCTDCVDRPAKVSGLVAWRPVDPERYDPNLELTETAEDEKEYLVKWEDKSHYQCVWKPGPWVWGVTAPAMRKAFAKRVSGPTMLTEDAIPEEYLRIDIVLDVKYTSKVDTQEEEVDKARIREVDQALMKFKGLGYEDAVWEKVPKPDDGDRWTDFVKAYDDWVMRRFVKAPKSTVMKQRLEKSHAIEFTTLEKKKQPDKLNGGELMKYQLDGLNWIYYRWWKKLNAVLADEMGLGKTIQVIGFLATLIQDHNCFPFLIVVPNGTVANWRREIKQWAPSIRVVTYFGSAVSRRMAYQYELFPDNAKELRCHVVVTSYEAAADESCRKFFQKVNWQGLIVDEGQRLKSDKTILYDALKALKIPFRLLLTGTPLQNNARELFNLLQFLDETFDAAALELEYAELTKENVPQLHELIRPFFLRRTKAQVLTFLPPMAQIVLPVSMSPLQAKLYKSILSRNPDLVKALYDPTSKGVGKQERANLNNLLMQLRKCLCHPFVYSQEIEERTDIAAVSHRNLVEASAKLQLLELLLPKLQQRGHRVLIFSQFLHMLDIVEDFLDGLTLGYVRLDGNVSSMDKQKRIDAYNAPNSPLFAFLLSTRSGGVGINLATADTVIILDPDFNPHQDIQALSRAHRIGQKNKVLCFQLMTRASAEEKIVQIGRKKMALDHVLIESMENEDEAGIDVESILKFGAADILEGKNQEIRYDDASIDKLLDRSSIEDTKAGEDNSAESQFSFARVWANETNSLADSLDSNSEEEKAPDPSVWDQILRDREKQAAEEAKARQEMLGRGRRARQTVDYQNQHLEDVDTPQRQRKRDAGAESSDTDFQAEPDDDKGDETADEGEGTIDERELAEVRDPDQAQSQREPGGLLGPARVPTQQSPSQQPRSQPVHPQQGQFQSIASRPGPPQQARPMPAPQAPAPQPRPQQPRSQQPRERHDFKRAAIRWPGPGQPDPLFADHKGEIDPDEREELEREHPMQQCFVCSTAHRQGYCPLKIAGPEYCNLCGLAHYGVARSCPHIRSETQVREMLEALRNSPESKELIEMAKKYLTGVKGTIVQDKKKKAEKAAFENALRMQQNNASLSGQTAAMSNVHFGFSGAPGMQAPQMRPPASAPPQQQRPPNGATMPGQRLVWQDPATNASTNGRP